MITIILFLCLTDWLYKQKINNQIYRNDDINPLQSAILNVTFKNRKFSKTYNNIYIMFIDTRWFYWFIKSILYHHFQENKQKWSYVSARILKINHSF